MGGGGVVLSRRGAQQQTCPSAHILALSKERRDHKQRANESKPLCKEGAANKKRAAVGVSINHSESGRALDLPTIFETVVWDDGASYELDALLRRRCKLPVPPPPPPNLRPVSTATIDSRNRPSLEDLRRCCLVSATEWLASASLDRGYPASRSMSSRTCAGSSISPLCLVAGLRASYESTSTVVESNAVQPMVMGGPVEHTLSPSVMACEWISIVPHVTPAARRGRSFSGDVASSAGTEPAELNADVRELTVSSSALFAGCTSSRGAAFSSVDWRRLRRPKFSASALGVVVLAGADRLRARWLLLEPPLLPSLLLTEASSEAGPTPMLRVLTLLLAQLDREVALSSKADVRKVNEDDDNSRRHEASPDSDSSHNSVALRLAGRVAA
jgi:hypothetical protein